MRLVVALRRKAAAWVVGGASVVAVLLAGPGPALAQPEAHFQYGSHTNPFTDESRGTVILTMQHASMWKFGDNFFLWTSSTTGARTVSTRRTPTVSGTRT